MKRAFVCDPACVESRGHNLQALLGAAEMLRDAHSVHLVACRHLAPSVAEQYGIRLMFSWYYPGVFSSTVYPFPDMRGLDVERYLVQTAIADAGLLLDSVQADAEDLVLFPSADFYGVLGMLDALIERPEGRRPTFCIRLLNVMEHAARGIPNAQTFLLDRLRIARAAGLRISIAAETAHYASDLRATLCSDVPVVAYPVVENAEALPREGSFVVGHLGTPRRDKGYFDVLQVAKDVTRRDDCDHVVFRIQWPSVSDSAEWIEYIGQLYALPRVEFVPDGMDRKLWQSMLSSCHAHLLPYDLTIYEQRGSAIATEAIVAGRAVVTLAQLPFASEVIRHGVGVAAASIGGLGEAISKLANMPLDLLESRLSSGRLSFLREQRREWERWLTW